MEFTSALSITFGDQAENGVGMEMIGKPAERGLSRKDLDDIRIQAMDKGYITNFMDLRQNVVDYDGDDACVLIIKNGVEFFTDGVVTADALYVENSNLDFDKKCWMRGKVKNKLARWNLCYADFDQEPCYEEKRGRVVNFNKLNGLNKLRDGIAEKMKIDKMPAEMNVYYDVKNGGIGAHGDRSRKYVICARLGEKNPMYFAWYHKCERVGRKMKVRLSHGDVYLMAEKAVGRDWKKRNSFTLRHAAGCKKYTK